MITRHKKILSALTVLIFTWSQVAWSVPQPLTDTLDTGERVPVVSINTTVPGTVVEKTIPGTVQTDDQFLRSSPLSEVNPLTLPSAGTASLPSPPEGDSPQTESSLVASAALASAPSEAELSVSEINESNFITRLSTGMYEVSIDAYMQSQLDAILTPELRQKYSADMLTNVEVAAIQSRVMEQLAGLYDFVVFFPTSTALSLTDYYGSVVNTGVLGFGSPQKQDIKWIII